MIEYKIEPELSPVEFIDILQRSTLAARRPVQDETRIATMLLQADAIVCARTSEGLLVGVARAITDFAYCTYLSDLAVDTEFQRRGIGRSLISQVHEHCGLATQLILLAAPAATEYYPHIGMKRYDSCWIMPTETPIT